jgi:hypothetical protein
LGEKFLLDIFTVIQFGVSLQLRNRHTKRMGAMVAQGKWALRKRKKYGKQEPPKIVPCVVRQFAV